MQAHWDRFLTTTVWFQDKCPVNQSVVLSRVQMLVLIWKKIFVHNWILWLWTLFDTHLGLPSTVVIDRWESFVHLLERIIKMLQNWNENILSMGGKEILLKAVIQSIPVLLCRSFRFYRKFVKRWLMLCRAFGAEIVRNIIVWTAWHGGTCVFRRRR